MLAATPPPAFTPPEEVETTPTPAPETAIVPPAPRPRPERPDSSFQALKEQTRITGRITNRGKSAVNAVETPLGRYQKAVSDAIGSRWYHYVNSKIDLVSIGTAHVEAQVDKDGKIQNLKVLSNNANEAFANICLQSFQEAQIPPIPEELVSALPDGRLPVDIYFTTYANR
jgi:outer membrane biosynthesis protein TonB